VAGDHFLELTVELGQGIEAAVDMRITQYFAAHLQAIGITVFLTHKNTPD
jgi:hypothetical protein